MRLECSLTFFHQIPFVHKGTELGKHLGTPVTQVAYPKWGACYSPLSKRSDIKLSLQNNHKKK